MARPCGRSTFTTLTDTVPNICLNTETGDYARIEQRECGCDLGRLGLTTHIAEVRSFEKGPMKASPSLAGGCSESSKKCFHPDSEARASTTSWPRPSGSTVRQAWSFRIRPEVGAVDDEAVRQVFLAELGRGGIIDRHHADLLRRAGSVAVVRRPPRQTVVGKMQPIHFLRQADGS